MSKNFYLDDAIKLVQETIETTDCKEALRYIKRMIDHTSAWATAQKLNCLNPANSAEDFMIEFMTAYNEEIGLTY